MAGRVTKHFGRPAMATAELQPRRLPTGRTTGGYVYRTTVAVATASAAMIDTTSTKTTQRRWSPGRRWSRFSERGTGRAYNGGLLSRCRYRLPRRRRRGTTATCGKHSQCTMEILLPIYYDFGRYTVQCYPALVHNITVYSVLDETSRPLW